MRSGPRPVDKKDARMKPWNTSAEIPMDEEDRCARPSLLKVAFIKDVFALTQSMIPKTVFC